MELGTLKEQLIQKKKQGEGYEYVYISSTDLTKTFDDSIKEAWNYHKNQIECMYNEILGKFQAKYEALKKKVEVFEALCEDGNVIVSYRDMTANSVVSKLMIIEDNPQVIWNALEYNFGSNFFTEMIESKLGVTQDYKEALFNRFKQKIMETNQENIKILHELESKMKKEVRKLKEIIA